MDEAAGLDRILTAPNVITLVRLLCIPLFLWLLFADHRQILAAILLAALGATDWIDGHVARRYHQVSTLGKVLDPAADRILVGTAVISVMIYHAVPLWFGFATIAREILVSLMVLLLASLGAARIDVLWWGKVSTFALMTSFPLFLLTTNPHHAALHAWQHDVRDACWVLGVLGLALSWIVLAGYVRPALRALRTGRDARKTL